MERTFKFFFSIERRLSSAKEAVNTCSIFPFYSGFLKLKWINSPNSNYIQQSAIVMINLTGNPVAERFFYHFVLSCRCNPKTEEIRSISHVSNF